MAKKKAAKRKRSVVKKKTAGSRSVGTRSPATKRLSSRKKAAARKKTAAKTGRKKSAKKKSAANKPAKKKKAAGKKRPRTLGRPRVAADAKLDLVFQKDYKAREVFQFLRVTTMRDLEAFGPDEIVDRLTRPLVETVQRIRKSLAMMNRCLANDRDFALDFRAEFNPPR